MIGLGIDLVEIRRFEIILKKGGLLERCFCKSEITRYNEIKNITYLAGRFAAKEAVVKALGTGLIDGLSLCDIEITNLPSGAPEIRLTDMAEKFAFELGIEKWHVSISHTENYATAIVIAE